MKLITLEKIHHALQTMTHRVTVPPDIAARARHAIDRMLEIT
jgi:quinolinate synthase